MRFEKWQALGNDYLIFEASELDAASASASETNATANRPATAARRPLELTPARIRRICDPHFGVGGDGLLLLEASEREEIVARLAIFNPDGSRAELSGNGSREAILYLRHRGWTNADRFTIETDAGPISPQITGADTCTVDIGRAALSSKDFPHGPSDGLAQLDANGTRLRFRHVSVGNPQCAIAIASVAELEALDLPAIGPAIEGHEIFPNRTNVSWYAELSPGRIRARIFERGVGETLSSGTGASGAAIAYALTRGGERAGAIVTVVLDGGELTVEVGDDLQVHLTGWAREVFAGRLSDKFIEELHATE